MASRNFEGHLISSHYGFPIQEFMAGQLGMAQSTYSKIEKDEKARIGDDLLDKISGVPGVSPEDIKRPMPIIMNFHNSPYGVIFLQQYLLH